MIQGGIVVHDSDCNPLGTNYCVSTIDGSRFALLAGPYAAHEEALEQVDRVRREACELGPKAWFYSFGTASTKDNKPGILDRLKRDKLKKLQAEYRRLEAD